MPPPPPLPPPVPFSEELPAPAPALNDSSSEREAWRLHAASEVATQRSNVEEQRGRKMRVEKSMANTLNRKEEGASVYHSQRVYSRLVPREQGTAVCLAKEPEA